MPQDLSWPKRREQLRDVSRSRLKVMSCREGAGASGVVSVALLIIVKGLKGEWELLERRKQWHKCKSVALTDQCRRDHM